MIDDGLEIFDSLDSCNQKRRQKTINVLESAGYFASGNEFKKEGSESVVVGDDGSWKCGKNSGDGFQRLNVFLWKLSKDNQLI